MQGRTDRRAPSGSIRCATELACEYTGYGGRCQSRETGGARSWLPGKICYRIWISAAVVGFGGTGIPREQAAKRERDALKRSPTFLHPVPSCCVSVRWCCARRDLAPSTVTNLPRRADRRRGLIGTHARPSAIHPWRAKQPSRLSTRVTRYWQSSDSLGHDRFRDKASQKRSISVVEMSSCVPAMSSFILYIR